MKKVKKYVSMLNPFQNREDVPTPVFVAKKLLAFCFLYLLVGCIAGEVFIIGGLTLAGYNPIQGIMPADSIMQLIQYYGFAFFLLAAILYCNFVEKVSIKEMGFTKRIGDYLVGGILAIILLLVIVAIGCITGGITFAGINDGLGIYTCITWSIYDTRGSRGSFVSRLSHAIVIKKDFSSMGSFS